MPKPRVILTRQVVPEPLAPLRERTDLWINPEDRELSRAELLERVREAEGLLCMLSEAVDRELLEAAPRLRVVANYAVGYDNIDVPAATARKVAVCNTPGVLTEATADLAWALLLAVARRTVEGDADMRRDRGFGGVHPTGYLGIELAGKTLGIVGMGRIGQAVARRAAGFRMRVLYHNRRELPGEIAGPLGAERVSMDALLARADVVTLHCPLTPETRHLIDAAALARMKPDAILLNTARGPVVDEAALAEALREGRLFGAGLDVYEREPEVHPTLFGLRNVVLSPHIGSATRETRAKMAELCVSAILLALEGKAPPNCLNPEVFG